MKTVALISGGKDSCYNMMQCISEGHEIVALANLKPKDKDELDSYMYQTVGHHAIDLYADAMGLPLYRNEILGTSMSIGKDYQLMLQDEVEDLYKLLKTVKENMEIEAVSVGAILSNYQRVRVENVCQRLNLTCLSYLWRRDQAELLREIINCQIEAIVIKVAALGLKPDLHLGKRLSEIEAYLLQKNAEFDLNVCGEGGEYETFTLDCPLFNKKIVIDEVEYVIHSEDPFAPVGYLNIKKSHLEQKSQDGYKSQVHLHSLPMYRSSSLMAELFPDKEQEQDVGLESEHLQIVGTQTKLLDVIDVPKPHMLCQGYRLYICNLQAMYTDSSNDDIRYCTSQAMDKLQKMVHAYGPEWQLSDLVIVHLYVKSLSHFSIINAVYRSYFDINPPARVCVQTDLPDNVLFMLDCIGHRNHLNRDSMHVQSLSHWAPANIGPYSQCVKIDDTIYVAGQIGLVPASMSIIQGGVQVQARLSLRHVLRILSAMSTGCSLKNILCCVCYLTSSSYVPIAQKEFHHARDQVPHTDSMVPCFPVYVIISQLPRGALIEWQMVASATISLQHKVWQLKKSIDCLECVATCVLGSDIVEEKSINKLCSFTANIYTLAVKESSVSSIVMLKLLHQCVQEVFDSSVDRCGESLLLLTMFYPSSLFTFVDIFEACKNVFEEQPVSIIPVLQLERDDLVLSVVCHQ